MGGIPPTLSDAKQKGEEGGGRGRKEKATHDVRLTIETGVPRIFTLHKGFSYIDTLFDILTPCSRLIDVSFDYKDPLTESVYTNEDFAVSKKKKNLGSGAAFARLCPVVYIGHSSKRVYILL